MPLSAATPSPLANPSERPDTDDALWVRSVRFAATVTAPIAVGLVVGPQAWLVYGLTTAIVCYASDGGGPPLPRLLWMSLGAAALVAGAVTGSLVAGSPVAITLAFAAAGVIYALTESAHQLALTASRFLCFALGIGALYIPIRGADVLAIGGFLLLTWAISVVSDLLVGRWRASNVPDWPSLVAIMRAKERERWSFAAAVGLVIPLACWASIALGLERPYWSLLALVLVLRVDFLSSRRLMVERFVGTVLGVAIAAGYAALVSSHLALIAGIVVAALARWPAQQRHGALGVGALTAFVMLMVELFIASRGEALLFLEARVVDTLVGCGFALLALGLDRLFRLLLRLPGIGG